MLRTVVFAVAALCALWVSAGAARAEPGIAVLVELSTLELECDGDSARLSVTAVDFDGTPAAGATVTVEFDGSIVVPAGGSFEEEAVGQTNSGGRFTARLRPTPGTVNYAQFWVGVDGATSYRGDIVLTIPTGSLKPHIACPYGGHPHYGIGDRSIAAHFWGDTDADGAMDGDERFVRNLDASLAFACYHCAILGHHERTDSRGTAVWEGLWALPPLGDGVPPQWDVCVDPNYYTIVSVNGVPYDFGYRCFSIMWLDPGVTEIFIGVRRVGNPPGAP